MGLTTGTRLGPYEVTAQIGVGGMGEVYRARDTTLGRDVAVKVLPDAFAHDADRLARFEREAKTLAALNHPNIATIHGVEESGGTHALVMELVEGETLEERIATGPIPTEEALRIAQQIAEALQAAHEQAIIHRDLKPANIKVRPDGTVKVLDFGLAKALEASPAAAGALSMSPTITTPAMNTAVGVLLGTAAYMSPEQAKGKPADKRADIWAFGCVLYEMLTGRRAFAGDDVTETLAAIVLREPNWSALPAALPPAIRALLRRCLERDRGARLPDIAAAVVLIEEAPRLGEQLPVPHPPATTGRSRATVLTGAVAAMAMAAAAALAWVHFGEQAQPADEVRFQIFAPEGTTLANTGVLSPDGRHLVFEAPGPDARMVLWLRSMDSLEVRMLPGTEGVAPGPFWSPDSRYLAFGVNGFPGRLKKIDAAGGPPQTVGEYTGAFREGAWSAEGVIVFGAGPTGLAQVPDGGGTSTLVTSLDPARQEVQHAGPTFLPGGRQFLYHRASRAIEHRGIYIGSLDVTAEAQDLTRLLPADSDPVFVPAPDSRGGFILFLRESTLLAQRFDGRSLLLGTPHPIAQGVGNVGTYGWFSASATGALAFRSGGDAPVIDLLWFDREGRRLGQLGARMEAGATGLNISSDGTRVATSRVGVGRGSAGALQDHHVWTAEVSRGIFSRLSAGDGSERDVVFSPDGRLAFSSTLNGAIGDLYWMSASGVGAPEPLLVKSPTVKHPNDFSPDGRFLIYDDHTAQQQDLWILPVDAPPGGERRPIPFLVTQADETFGQFSPDGKWVAYSSDESGRREVYVQGFAPDRVPAASVGKWQISTAGGDKPRWRHDGRELYYLALDGTMMAVPIAPGPAFNPGVAVPLFQTRAMGFFPYDVTTDGRFLVATLGDLTAPASAPITIVLNWQRALTR